MSALNDPKRLSALARTELMDAPVQASLARSVRLAQALLRPEVALVSLVDDHRQFFASHLGLPAPWSETRETPLSHSFCQHVVTSEEALVITDARTDPRVQGNGAIQDLGVLSYLGIPIRLSSGEVLGSFCVIGTTPRDWTDSEIAIMADLGASVSTEVEIRLVARARDELVATVAHDLKNPLSSILLNLEMLGRAKSPSTELITKFTERAQRSLKWMNRLIEKTLRDSRSSFLESSHSPSFFPFYDLFAELHEMTELLAERARIRLEFVAEGDAAKGGLRADRERLLQILENLVSNAIHHSGPETAVSVVAQYANEDENDVVFEVRDRGKGMNATELDQMWRPFFSVHGQSTSTKSHGYGLYIVKKLVQAHGGKIEATSEPGVGTTFRITLPRARSP